MAVLTAGNLNLFLSAVIAFLPYLRQKYTMDRTTSMSFKLVNVTHRHCVFTIDENLREFLLKDRFSARLSVSLCKQCYHRMFFKMNKSKTSRPVLLWFYIHLAEILKWNPHIHCLISEGGYSDDGFWRNVKHFDYTFYAMLSHGSA